MNAVLKPDVMANLTAKRKRRVIEAYRHGSDISAWLAANQVSWAEFHEWLDLFRAFGLDGLRSAFRAPARAP